MRGKWLEIVLRIVIYGGIGLIILLALSPILLIIFAEPGSITIHPCDNRIDECTP
jgi:hypothetical protein